MRTRLLSFAFLCSSLLLIALARPGQGLATRQSCGAQADPARRDAVVEAFKQNYDFYEKYAFGADVLNLVHKNGSVDGAVRDFAGTIIDALDAMIVMGMGDSDQYKRGLEKIKTLTFDHSNYTDGDPAGVVKVFEWTIRLIGAMLAAYQQNGEKAEERFLVDKAELIAKKLSIAWVGDNKIPFGKISINNNTVYHEPDTPRYVYVAEAGTLNMEWGMLSQYTKNDKYKSLTEGATNAILASKPIFPGIWDLAIYPDNNTAALHYATLGGGYDSFFEYLLKYPLLIGAERDHPYVKAWETGTQSMIDKMVRKTAVKNYTFLSDFDVMKKEAKYSFGHLTCFIGGSFAMGGRMLGNDDWTRLGLEITESCAHLYTETELKLGPYIIGYADTTGNFTGWDYVSTTQRSYHAKHGFFTSDPWWVQAPETIESLFYAYRITGDKRWQDMAWDIFQTIKAETDTGHGWAPIVNVNDPSTGIIDQQGTYLYGELLKYFYLIFDDPEHYSLDKYVFTTEGHIFNRPAGPWAKVQGCFPYEFVVGKTAADTQLPSPTPTTSPSQKYFEAQPGAGRAEAAKATASQLDIELGPAKAMFSPVPTYPQI